MKIYLWGLFICVILLSCHKSGKSESLQQKSPNKINVQVEILKRGEINNFMNYSATLQSLRKATVVAMGSGYIEDITVELGDFVNRDKLLSSLEKNKEILRVKLTELTYNKLKKDYQRAQEKKQQDIIPSTQLEQIEYQLKSAKLEMDIARKNLRDKNIYSTIKGQIDEIFIEEGNMLSMGQKAFSIIDNSQFVVEIFPSERDINRFQKGDTVKILTNLSTKNNLFGIITDISPSIDSKTGTFRIKATIDNTDHILKSGMYVTVSVLHNSKKNIVKIPQRAIIDYNNQKYIFILKDSLVRRKKITVCIEDSVYSGIDEIIEEGNKVITIGKNLLQDSSLVQIIN